MASSLCVVLAVLALGLVHVEANSYIWTGGNMDFSNRDNWLNGLAPNATNLPCTTTFGSPSAVILSNLGARTYYVGSTLYMPPEGTLYLSTEGTGTIVYFDPDAESTCIGDYVWTGGLQFERRNDIYCHTNWAVNVGALGLRQATETPCAGDSITFSASSTYHVSIASSVSLFVVDSVTLNSNVPPITISDNAQRNLVLPQVNLFSNTSIVYIGTNPTRNALIDVCIPNNQYDPVNLKCICYSSCPTPAMQEAADARIRAALQSQANQTLVAMNTYHRVSFNGFFNAASLSMQQNQFNTALRNPADPSNSLVASAIAAALLDVPAASVTDVTVSFATADNSTVRVSGTINATASGLFPVGFSSLSPPGNIWWNSTTSTLPTNVTRTQTITQATLSTVLFSTLATILAQQAADQASAQGPAVQSILSQIKANPHPANASAALSLDTCYTSCGSGTSCSACSAATAASLQAAGYTAAQASALTTQLELVAGPTYGDTLGTIQGIIATFVASQSASSSASQTAMREYTLNSPTLYIGRFAPVDSQLRSVTSTNYANTVQSLSQALTGYQGLNAVTNMQLRFVSTVPSSSSSNSVSRRAAESASGIAVTFTYNTTCSSVDTACQTPFTPSSGTGTSVQQKLDNTFNVLTFGSNPCYTGTTPNGNCLSAIATSTCSSSLTNGRTSAQARQDAYNAIFNLTECGGTPRFPSGACLAVNPYAASYTNSLTQPSALACGSDGNGGSGGTGASASSSGSGVPIVPIAAAAGGGVLLLAVVALLLLRRKRNMQSSPNKKLDDRTVVAFENPMYDEPATAGVQPTYDAAHTEGEGLYDEPAFNQSTTKQNPVYQSTENIAEAANALGGEYQPTDDGPDGYLDVSPEKRPTEDVGYLENPQLNPTG